MSRNNIFCTALIFIFAIICLMGCGDSGTSPITPTSTPGSQPTTIPTEAPAGTWSASIRVDDGAAAKAADTSSTGGKNLTVDSSGNAYAIWIDNRSGNWDVYSSYRSSGGSWEASQLVYDAPVDNTSLEPSIAVDSSGNAYAVWAVKSFSDNGDVYFSYRPSGGTWGTAERVDDNGVIGTLSGTPDIAVDGDGNAYVVFYDGRDGNGNIYFATRSSAGVWSANEFIDDNSANANLPSIGVDSSGNSYVVWCDERSGDWDIYFSKGTSGAWITPVRVDNGTEGTDAYNPSIAVDTSGNSYIVWDDERDGEGNDVYFAYRSSGGTWASNERVDKATSTDDEATYPAIAVDSSGNAYAVWHDERNEESRIYASYRPANGTWGNEERVDDTASGVYTYFPSVAADNTTGYAIWTDTRSGDDAIYFSTRE